mmetsp:Transcript_29030/g.69113  ORF Transcript_29030/g.69113 Transcript_29030/m.69113 type:complete len:388 (-) Transcript_29030:144-1307(-)|eukprot:CAMPEP_0181440868 /NCGR_PEP_ID=MMETSP1110-20121109/23202_1 /TAXON_ID=174948 /ORGANISM="Symbiodinium sp., Strain CCMP421" /LENGTH=387 /DNA_ID=CAMNT_0023564711 /DNA_START=43 /DNA_END=1206 /DNA_ORIENTATION=-
MNGQMLFSSPPGLEPDLGDFAPTGPTEVRAVTAKALEEKLKGLGPQASREAILEAIRELVLSEVEHKVQEKSEEMWSKGKQFVSQLQLRHAEKMTEMVEDLGRCQKKQSELEAENERLKQALQSLGSHFALLGNSFDSKEYNSSPDSAVSTAPGLSPPEEPEAKAPPYTPEPYAQAAQAAAEVLAQVPPFPPFGSPAPMSPPPAISIAESLGAGVSTPQRTPLSLMQSLATPLTPLPSPFTVNGLAGVGLVGGCGIFSFTLRKADGAELGLNVSHSADDRVLCVEGIREGGAVEAWNRQCGAGTPFAEKTVLPGDRILSVNKVSYDPNLMLQECREKQLLKLTIARGNIPLPAAQEDLQFPIPQLRADANEFVPYEEKAPAQKPSDP